MSRLRIPGFLIALLSLLAINGSFKVLALDPTVLDTLPPDAMGNLPTLHVPTMENEPQLLPLPLPPRAIYQGYTRALAPVKQRVLKLPALLDAISANPMDPFLWQRLSGQAHMLTLNMQVLEGKIPAETQTFYSLGLIRQAVEALNQVVAYRLSSYRYRRSLGSSPEALAAEQAAVIARLADVRHAVQALETFEAHTRLSPPED